MHRERSVFIDLHRRRDVYFTSFSRFFQFFFLDFSLSSTMTKKSFNFFPVLVISLLSIIIFQTQNLFQCYPWLLLWTPFREETMKAWREYAPINSAIIYPLRPIPEIQAKGENSYLVGCVCLIVCLLDYSIQNLIKASEGFRRPVVIRYLFLDLSLEFS